jgi:urease accessory protein
VDRVSYSSLHIDKPLELEAFFAILQLSDSSFPNGRYTHSFGVETFAQSGILASPSSVGELATLLTDWVRFGVTSSDAIAMACAHRALSALDLIDLKLVTAADERLSAVKLARESREASARTGRAVLRTVGTIVSASPIRQYGDLVHTGRTPGNNAIVMGLLSAWLGVPRLEALAGEIYAFCASWVAAAMRLGVADHVTAQLVLHEVRPACARAAQKAVDGDVKDISSCTPLADVMAMRHEQAELRLFAS